MGAPRVTDKVLDFLHRHQNVNVTIQEIREDTGLTRAQIVSSIGRLRARYGVDVTPVVAGNVYRYKSGTVGGGVVAEAAPVPPAPKPTPAPTQPATTMFELVGTSKSGAVVIQDESGKLYRAEEL
jgi:hypothetical protein